MPDTKLKKGDTVRIADRDQTAEDTQSGLFYNHYRTLAGIVDTIYPSGEVVVEVNPVTLAADVKQRLVDMQETMRSKWLDSLSEEARGRLSPAEQQFQLKYAVLVNASDVLPVEPGFFPAPPPESPAIAAEPAAPRLEAASTMPAIAAEQPMLELDAEQELPEIAAETPPKRLTSADLDAMEEAELERHRKALQDPDA
ncbi:MAG: hypothetical protein KGJ62_03430 [Armatimonadetes bacterium]|nr:hypothetical protein [Armatimonadota bacterium]MDE2205714.1 hypothetical protein [Armatimonadota bacterium]